jgi:hypothetical protein
VDDDSEEPTSYGHDDARRLQIGSGMGTLLTYTITAEVPSRGDPIDVMDKIERNLFSFFGDEEMARRTWITKARAHGLDIDEDTPMTFSEPAVKEDSVSINRPADFMTHHYNSNGSVRLGTWLGASVAGLALVISAKYGFQAFRLKREEDVLAADNAAEWANVDEGEGGDVTMNPLGGSPTPTGEAY